MLDFYLALHNIEVKNKIQDQISAQKNITPTKEDKTALAETKNPETIETNIEQESNIATENTITIKAPLVGTFYKSSKPDMPPFISEGDIVKEGQIICIIEAMKIFNEIESEYSGKVLKILVENATPIEYDQALLILSPE